jgi:uncharacterized protein YprB with RNaseH-like and TPR domain
MHPSRLTDRLRAIVEARPPHLGSSSQPGEPGTIRDQRGAERPVVCEPGRPGDFGRILRAAERTLDGSWRSLDGLSGFVVERRQSPETLHGGERLGTIARLLAAGAAEAPLVIGRAPAPGPFVFFDLETTGLSGGAGTCAFLIGCGSFDQEGGFRTRQYLLLRQGDERELLQMVAVQLAAAGVLVTFNGKSFDAPLIETRYLFHRIAWTAARVPHLDVLHPARRFWGERGAEGRCSLTALEQTVLGARRRHDVAGFEIPARYFAFIRSGDPTPLGPVLEHNRLDLLSLAGLTARLLNLVQRGPAAARDAGEARALGRLYARSGLSDRARDAYERALAAGAPSVTADVLRSLALLCRRSRRYDDAAVYWRRLLETGGCPPELVREASEALAVHHEHRARDLAAAKTFALRSLTGLGDSGGTRTAARHQALLHRLARIERKMGAGTLEATGPSGRPTLFPS